MSTVIEIYDSTAPQVVEIYDAVGPQGVQGPPGPPGPPGPGDSSGETEIDFGATPTNEGSVTVTGQTGITSASVVQVSLPAKETLDNVVSDAEFAAVALQLSVGNIVDNVGFTVKAFCTIGLVSGKFKIQYRW